MALWFGVTAIDMASREIVDQQIHGPFEDIEALDDAVNTAIEEATLTGDDIVAVPMRFELCTDDVPELVSSEEILT